jgi:hypothetical protein
MMDTAEIQAFKSRVELIRLRRPAVAKLLEKSNLGMLRVDVNQALEEIDELIEEFDEAFSETEPD